MRTATRSASRLTALAFSAMPRPSVLVIDAHPAHLPGYQAVLTQLGIECVCASSTQSAFEFLVHQPCIGIVIDHGVDVSNRIETARRVRRTPGLEHTPIVFVITKHMTDVDALGTAELGSVDYMLLPIVPEILRSKVALFHELHRQRLEIAQLSDRLDAIFPGGENSIISSGADVTTRNRDAEHELQALLDELHAEREWLMAVLNCINDEVYFTDAQRRYTYANPPAMREFGHVNVAGIAVEEIVSELVVLRPDGTPRPIEEAPPLRALTGEVVRNEEQLVHTRRTSQLRHRQVSSVPVRNDKGQIVGSVSMARDITETKQAESRLRDAVEQAQAAAAESRAALAAELVAMKRLHHLSTIAFTASDQQALLEEILDATIALHGADFGTMQLFKSDSKTLRIAAQRGFEQWFVDQFADVSPGPHSTCGLALECGERVIVEDIEVDHRFKSLVSLAQQIGWRAVQSTPLFTADGATLGMLSTFFHTPRKFSKNELRLTDLYAGQAAVAIERRRAEAALVEARESADRANKTKSHFVRAASHDLRQSVQTLAMLNGSLRSPSDTFRATALQQQSEAIDTMMHLLDALLNISKLESGAVRAEVVDFPVASLFEKLRMEFSGAAADRGLALAIEPADSLAIRSDPTLVGEILRNLLSNAIKFTSQGSITVRCTSAGANLRLDVIDAGIGIPRDELALIFDEFYQVGVGATVNRQGYGLGLGIVQRMATLLQAGIEVESELGKGSRFSLIVPAGKIDSTERGLHNRVANCQTTAHTILLVEDDPSVRASMELFFKVHGHRIVSATSLEETLAAMEQLRPEVLITDFHLPDGKTGCDVISSVRKSLGETFPAIVISGDTSAEIANLSRDAHLRFVSKPIDADNLVSLVEELLERDQLTDDDDSLRSF